MKHIKITNQTISRYPRRLTRLKDFDYSQPGAYFITICTQAKSPILGDIIGEKMVLNPCGMLAESCWMEIPNHYSNAKIDVFVIMPDHIHGIIILEDTGAKPNEKVAGLKPATTGHPLAEIIRGFKTFSARQVNQLRGMTGSHLWQRNYYEHIIRSESELNSVREYIDTNPLRWAMETKIQNIDMPSIESKRIL